MTEALRAEWMKLSSVSGTAWTVLAAVVSTIGLGVAAVAVNTTSSGSIQDPTKLSLTGIELGQAVLAVLAVTTIAGEYATGLIGVSLTAIPRRWTLLGAKAAVIGGVALAAGGAAVAGSLLATRLLVSDDPTIQLSIRDGATLRAITGSVVYLALIALMSLGIATAVRDAASAIGIVFALLYLFPILAHIVDDPTWERRIQRLGPRTAGQAIQTTIDGTGLPIGPWAGLGVVAAWAAAALVLGGALLSARDA